MISEQISRIPPSIFDRDWQTSLNQTIPLSTNTFPTSDIFGSDVKFTYSSIPVVIGDVFAPVLILFMPPNPATVGGLGSLIDLACTVLSDENFQPIP